MKTSDKPGATRAGRRNMDEIKLKPCPFCGTSGQVQQAGKMWFVECVNDTTLCPVNPWTGYFKNKYEAITVWNRRADNG